MPDNIRVVVRFRPENSVEKNAETKEDEDDSPAKSLSIIDNKTINMQQIPTLFDEVLDHTTTQDEAFVSVAEKLCDDILNGFNATIFVYGQTGSGKTYTMYGEENTNNVSKMGIIPRSISFIFGKLNNDKSLIEYQIKVSFVEIYNEQLKDLLIKKGGKKTGNSLKIRLNEKRETYVDGLSNITVKSIGEVLKLISIANENRTTFATKMNATSSRGHLLMQVNVWTKARVGNHEIIQVGIANFADLAGSERVKKTQASGKRFSEACSINASLSILGRVIFALTSKKKAVSPYRESKLTHILKDSLGGNCKTTLVVTGSTHIYNREETINSLKFGLRCKQIKTKAKVNRIYTKNELLARVQALEKQNEELQHQGGGSSADYDKLFAENERLKKENQRQADVIKKLRANMKVIEANNEIAKGTKTEIVKKQEILQKEVFVLQTDNENKDKTIQKMEELVAQKTTKEVELENEIIEIKIEMDDLNFAYNSEKNKVEAAENILGFDLKKLTLHNELFKNQIAALNNIVNEQQNELVKAENLFSDATKASICSQAMYLEEFINMRMLQIQADHELAATIQATEEREHQQRKQKLAEQEKRDAEYIRRLAQKEEQQMHMQQGQMQQQQIRYSMPKQSLYFWCWKHSVGGGRYERMDDILSCHLEKLRNNQTIKIKINGTVHLFCRTGDDNAYSQNLVNNELMEIKRCDAAGFEALNQDNDTDGYEDGAKTEVVQKKKKGMFSFFKK